MASSRLHAIRTTALIICVLLSLWSSGALGHAAPTTLAPEPLATLPLTVAPPAGALYIPLVAVNRPPSGQLLLSEIAPTPGGVDSAWIEIASVGNAPASLRRLALCDLDGNSYALPDGLPDLPPDGYLLILLDGLGSIADECDPSDGLMTLHTPVEMVGCFEPEGDQCALYRLPDLTPATLIDFVAWGQNSADDDDIASDASLWVDGAFCGAEPAPGGLSLSENGSLGRRPLAQCGAPSCWVPYGPTETSPGAANPGPAPVTVSPANGAAFYSDAVDTGWFCPSAAETYDLELAQSADMLAATAYSGIAEPHWSITQLKPGDYYWRVRAHCADGPTDWSPVSHFALHDPAMLLASYGARLTAAADLGIVAKQQHKDTGMLCIEGCPEEGNSAWDREHTAWNLHDQWYCTRASIAMAASHYGGRLSQDYISYYAFGRNDPEDDLGHGIGLWPNDNALPANAHGHVLQWAMNGGAITTVPPANLTFAQLKGFIDARRPLVIVQDTGATLHTCVIDGYTHLQVLNLDVLIIHLIDPWGAKERAHVFGTVQLVRVHVPAAGAAARSDPDEDGDRLADTVDDSDGDGMVDFDEKHRFHTDAANRDTDDDCVEDKNDVRGYVFDLLGNYDKRRGDLAGGDLLRKERDAHNDLDNGRCDGDEDANRNGHTCDRWGNCEGLDTSNFDGWDDYLAPEYCHSPTPTPTRTATPRPSSTPRPTTTKRPTSTVEASPTMGTPTVSITPTTTGSPTVTRTGTPTRTATPTKTPDPALEDGCCQLPDGGCISGTSNPLICIEEFHGMWYPGFVCRGGECVPR